MNMNMNILKEPAPNHGKQHMQQSCQKEIEGVHTMRVHKECVRKEGECGIINGRDTMQKVEREREARGESESRGQRLTDL